MNPQQVHKCHRDKRGKIKHVCFLPGGSCLWLGWKHCGRRMLKLGDRVAMQHLKDHSAVIEVKQERACSLLLQHFRKICHIREPQEILQSCVWR